jgi:hypothetical protein
MMAWLGRTSATSAASALLVALFSAPLAAAATPAIPVVAGHYAPFDTCAKLPGAAAFRARLTQSISSFASTSYASTAPATAALRLSAFPRIGRCTRRSQAAS